MEDHGQSTGIAPLVHFAQFVRPRHVPDVPEDVDFVMEHLNDPNFDLTTAASPTAMSSGSFELERKSGNFTDEYSAKATDVETESQADSLRYSSAASRTESPFSEGTEFDDESPYPEVRAAVASVDDPTMPVCTFRMWFLGITVAILVAGLNQFMSMRYPYVLITGIVVQLATLPLGKGLEWLLPTTRFRTFGFTWSLNPGPFTIKEHVCITAMANVVVNGAYATDIVATQKVFYLQNLPFSYEILLVLSTQLVGFSFSGVLRRYIVWPASMIWPGALVNSALFNTLHRNYGRKETKHISRERFFTYVVMGSFVWYWFPGYLFTALSAFNWVCWIAPQNVAVNALFGTTTGLGMGIFTFDWAMISYVGSPLVTPWWAEANSGVGLIVIFWILGPIIYFSNAWYGRYLPMSSYQTFDNTGLPYDPNQVVTNGLFDVEKYRAYSPLFLTTTQALSLGLAFASFTSVIVHTFLWFRRDIARRFHSSLKDERDVHARLMQAYREVPNWWYASLGIVAFIMLVVCVEIYPTQLPVWGVVLGLFIAFCLSLPLGMLQAITNQNIALQVMHEMIAGYALPGRPVANMIFKCIAYIGANQAVGFCGDLKLGHYLKVPPRIMFGCQCIGAIIGCIVCTVVQNWMFSHIPDFCSPGQKHGFSCPSTNTFASASLIWGGIGPRRLFSIGKMYSPLLSFFIVGALAPIPFYLLARRYPLSIWRYVNMPVFFASISCIPPATGINFSSWIIVGFIFNYFMRRFHFRWWMRYNYILSAGMDAGLAISAIVIFLVMELPRGGIEVNWWGNNFWMTTADALGTPLDILLPGQTIGPKTWS